MELGFNMYKYCSIFNANCACFSRCSAVHQATRSVCPYVQPMPGGTFGQVLCVAAAIDLRDPVQFRRFSKTPLEPYAS